MRLSLFIIGVLCCQVLLGQEKRQSATPSMPTLDEINLEDTDTALADISTILEIALADDDYNVAGECYVLLANIYENNRQDDLAIGRRTTALSYFQLATNSSQITNQYLALGNLYKKANQLDQAKANYTLCIDAAQEEEVKLNCKEGLADVLLLRGEADKSLEYYNDLDDDYLSNNIPQSNARIKLKKAKIFASKKNERAAQENYKRGYENYSPEASDEDLAVLEEAKESMIKLEPVEDIPIRQQNIEIQSSLPNTASQINIDRENIKITESLVNKGNLDEAIAVIDNNIRETVEPSIKKDYYKLSADINAKKGNYEAAIQDLQQYETLTKQVLEEKTQEQNELIEVLKGQRLIDMQTKDLTIRSNKIAYDSSISKWQNWIIALLSLLLLGALVAFYFIYRNVKAKNQANQLLMLKSLRAQMNPHFIFNVLNSINHYISKNDERSANKYLSEFSKLMRKVLQDSQKDLITLEDELEMTEIYLKLEHTRFSDKFDYTINIDDSIDLKEINIPPMMIQPFLENAVWHGMRYKEEKGHINLELSSINTGIQIVIKDDGIGRTKSKALKTKNQQSYQSTGLKNIANRLDLVNDIYGKSYDITIDDLHPKAEETGTLVTIIINQ